MKYEVLNDMVLVRRVKEEGISEIEKNALDVSGVLSNKGEVVAVDRKDPQLHVGDIVLFSQHAANDVELDKEKFLLLNRKQIYLKLNANVAPGS